MALTELKEQVQRVLNDANEDIQKLVDLEVRLARNETREKFQGEVKKWQKLANDSVAKANRAQVTILEFRKLLDTERADLQSEKNGRQKMESSLQSELSKARRRIDHLDRQVNTMQAKANA